MRAALAHTLGAAGRTKEAFQMLDDLTELAKQKYVAPYFFAGIHIGLGENDRAMEYLEKSYEEHSHWLIYLHIDPEHGRLAGQPTFPGSVAAYWPALSDGRHLRLKDAPLGPARARYTDEAACERCGRGQTRAGKG